MKTEISQAYMNRVKWVSAAVVVLMLILAFVHYDNSLVYLWTVVAGFAGGIFNVIRYRQKNVQ